MGFFDELKKGIDALGSLPPFSPEEAMKYSEI